MSVRPTAQLGFADLLVRQRAGVNDGLVRLRDELDMAPIRALLGEVEPKPLGAPGYGAELLFWALLLGEIYGLSDPALEAALSDRLSFRRFVGLALDAEAPDHATLWRFRDKLSRSGLAERLFGEVNRQLEGRGLVLKKGTIVDATIIEAQARPRIDKPSADPDARFVKRGGRSRYGYKGHVAMDAGSGLIRAAELTPANVNDTEMAEALITGDEKAVYGDKAYDSQTRRRRLKAQGIKPRIALRANKHHPQLPPRQQAFNRLIEPVRRTIERLFGDMKRMRGWRRVKAFCLARNATRFHLLCLALNLKRAAVLAG